VALRNYQHQVNEQVLQEKCAVLREELDQRQKMTYIVVVGLIFIIFVVMVTVAVLVLFLRESKPCTAFLESQQFGEYLITFIALLKSTTVEVNYVRRKFQCLYS
jgi:predicted nucleic acid-binding Zn ribbon protein